MNRNSGIPLLLAWVLLSGAHPLRAETIVWPGYGEPLPVLKKMTLANTPSDGTLSNFMKMIDDAPIRPGVGVRTRLSPADGLATIVTDFIIRVCNIYLPYTIEHHQTKREHWLRKTIADHLLLLSTPAEGHPRSYRGGHLARGLDGKLDALYGSTTPEDVAVNQTAITVLTLEDMREFPDPEYQKQYGKAIKHLLGLFTPELKREVLRCYPANKPPRQWLYNVEGKLEDQSHLKTTWSQLAKLGYSKSKHAAWYHAQAERIAKAYPQVLKSWESQSDRPGL